jgi:hypothetical protein
MENKSKLPSYIDKLKHIMYQQFEEYAYLEYFYENLFRKHFVEDKVEEFLHNEKLNVNISNGRVCILTRWM